jgi:hypothetical protein
MKPCLRLLLAATILAAISGCLNPFAPRLDTSPTEASLDLTTVDGVFRLFQKSYSTRDTTLYGALLDASFTFIYRDYEQGIDVSWGRDEELRTTYGLFQTAQRLDLIWNNIVSTSTDSTRLHVVRGFNLTVTFNPIDIERVDGVANLTLDRRTHTDPWKIITWRDESNF